MTGIAAAYGGDIDLTGAQVNSLLSISCPSDYRSLLLSGLPYLESAQRWFQPTTTGGFSYARSLSASAIYETAADTSARVGAEVSFYVYFSSVPSGDTTRRYISELLYNGTSTLAARLAYIPNPGQGGQHVFQASGSAFSTLNGTTPIEANKPYYITLRIRGGDSSQRTAGNAELWINGVLEVSSTASFTDYTSAPFNGQAGIMIGTLISEVANAPLWFRGLSIRNDWSSAPNVAPKPYHVHDAVPTQVIQGGTLSNPNWPIFGGAPHAHSALGDFNLSTGIQSDEILPARIYYDLPQVLNTRRLVGGVVYLAGSKTDSSDTRVTLRQVALSGAPLTSGGHTFAATNPARDTFRYIYGPAPEPSSQVPTADSIYTEIFRPFS